jgi:hypothetical protein
MSSEGDGECFDGAPVRGAGGRRTGKREASRSGIPARDPPRAESRVQSGRSGGWTHGGWSSKVGGGRWAGVSERGGAGPKPGLRIRVLRGVRCPGGKWRATPISCGDLTIPWRRGRRVLGKSAAGRSVRRGHRSDSPASRGGASRSYDGGLLPERAPRGRTSRDGAAGEGRATGWTGRTGQFAACERAPGGIGPGRATEVARVPGPGRRR